MSNVSIFEKKWLDLVFEGKNQKYGAYQLRRESAKTTLFALLFGSTFLLGGIFLLSSFNVKPIADIKDPFDGDIIRVNTVNPPINKTDEPKIERPKTENHAAPEVKPNAPLEVAPTPQAQAEVPTNAEQPRTPVTLGAPGTGTPGTTPINNGGGGTSTENRPSNNPVNSKELDRQPMFPGGIKNFYQYVGDNFERQQIEEGETVKVMVSFVIERNGTMTDIDVVEKTNPTVDKEAIRVLKSLKIKWAPGFKDGEAVRTRYTLPITVQGE